MLSLLMVTDGQQSHASGIDLHAQFLTLCCSSTNVTCPPWLADLFKRCPEPMYDALTLHNNVIRRAKYANCGSTVQQEGDSYTLVRPEAHRHGSLAVCRGWQDPKLTCAVALQDSSVYCGLAPVGPQSPGEEQGLINSHSYSCSNWLSKLSNQQGSQRLHGGQPCAVLLPAGVP